MICPHCAREIDDDCAFCPRCGKPLSRPAGGGAVGDIGMIRGDNVFIGAGAQADLSKQKLIPCPKCGLKDPASEAFECKGKCGRHDLCLRHFDDEFEMCKECAAASLYDAAWDYYERRDYDTATTYCSRAIERDSSHAEYYGTRGECFMEKGHYDRAIEDLTIAIRLNPRADGFLASRAACYTHKGDWARARDDRAAVAALWADSGEPE